MQFNGDCLFTNYVWWCATFIALKYARDERGHQRLGLTRKQVFFFFLEDLWGIIGGGGATPTSCCPFA